MGTAHVERKYHGVFTFLDESLNRSKLGELLVRRGYISPNQLRHALKVQKHTKAPLGQVCIDQNYIKSFDLFAILFFQRTMRFSLALCISAFSLSILLPKKSYAEKINDVPASIALTEAHNPQIVQMNQYPALFGAAEKRSTNLRAFTKWSGMFERFERSLKDRKSQKIIKNLRAELSAYKSNSVYDMAQNVNNYMNKQRYILDSKNWGKSDYWATPIEFLTHGGDCEDFAIAKYTALRALGVPESRLRLAIVQDLKKNIPHAILIVYSERGPLVLDNQIKKLRLTHQISHYKPIFSINREAWWLHTPAKKPATSIVASSH